MNVVLIHVRVLVAYQLYATLLITIQIVLVSLDSRAMHSLVVSLLLFVSVPCNKIDKSEYF